MKYPDIPGHNTEISKLAAHSMISAASALQERVYYVLKDHEDKVSIPPPHPNWLPPDKRGLTSEEVGDIIGYESVWKRMSELQRKRLVYKTGRTRRQRSGREGNLWRAGRIGNAPAAIDDPNAETARLMALTKKQLCQTIRGLTKLVGEKTDEIEQINKDKLALAVALSEVEDIRLAAALAGHQIKQQDTTPIDPDEIFGISGGQP